MKLKYLALSLIVHTILLFSCSYFRNLKREEPKALTPVISVSFLVEKAKASENPGSLQTAEKVLEKKENSKNEKPKEQKKVEKEKQESPKEKTWDSKVATKDAKEIQEEALVSEESDSKTQNTSSEEKQASSETNPFYGSNFEANGDGSYTALSSDGIPYEIIKEVEPEYPSQAESIAYEQVVKVKAKFLVGLQGAVEKVQIIKSHQKLGFDDEVTKAVKKWRFKPIYYAGKNIKVYFVKEFVFQPQ